MAAKKVDPIKAKAAKQKKIAIGGVVVLLALLGIQGPKTLKMLKGPQPVAVTSAAPAPVAAAPAATEAAAGTAAAEAPAAVTPELASVADSDPGPVVEDGQLATFERFASKDPFAQQAQAVTAPATPSDASGGADNPSPADGEGAAAAGSGRSEGAADNEGIAGAGGGFTKEKTAPARAEPAGATLIAVNGVSEDVKLKQAFPASEPTFVLVSLAVDGRSVEVGIAGGAYADGGETLKLTLGKRVTLQNTADGSRYELELLAIEGFAPPKRK